MTSTEAPARESEMMSQVALQKGNEMKNKNQKEDGIFSSIALLPKQYQHVTMLLFILLFVVFY